MSSEAPPNESLTELAAVLGVENVRTLVRTYLRDFPGLIQQLSAAERKNRHRAAHSMKSNSKLVGALNLSRRMAELEARLAAEDGQDVQPADLAAINAEFASIQPALRKFVGA